MLPAKTKQTAKQKPKPQKTEEEPSFAPIGL